MYDHSELIESSSGVQQGSSRALVLQYQKWYMDDGASSLRFRFSLEGWQILQEFTSTQRSVSGQRLPARAVVDSIALVPTDQICMLGVPLGSASFSASYVQ